MPKGSRLVIVGHGMVGAKFCQYLVERKLQHHYKTTVIGAEPMPAYDRIRLSSYVDDQNYERLLLRPQQWYYDNSIELTLDSEVEEINREKKTLRLRGGEEIGYDLLVLATGSRPFVPPIEGINAKNVFVYRTVRDIEAIIKGAKGKQSATVIGGGLLGLEAAQAVQKLGLTPTVVERANYLMPQQLNASASSLLAKEVRSQGIELFLGVQSIVIQSDEEKLELNFDGSTKTTADLVVVSAGILPNGELASDAGLATGLRGGVIVDEHFETSDPNIFAIGECALVGNRSYGLAAPGYAMAKHLADRLQGVKVLSFVEPDLSTRLKMLGADVISIGSPLEEGRTIEYVSDDCYRLLLLGSRGQLKGALGVGEWPEAGKIQAIFASSGIIREKEQEGFANEGELHPGSQLEPLNQWPDDRVVCNCMDITKGTLVSCLESCHRDPDLIATETQASTVCGSCRPLVEELCGTPVSTPKPIAARSLLVVSALAFLAVLFAIVSPPIAMAESVDSWKYRVDQLWRDSLIKQITGFSLLAVLLVGLSLSLRKRFRWFRIGHFAKWRFFHAAFGLTAVVVLFVHTGFRFGHNLNFWLMFTFVGLNLLGAIAGIVSAIESSGTSPAALKARQVRPILTYAHLLLFWPLPVLLVFHVLSVYLY